MKFPHLADVCRAGFHCNSGLFCLRASFLFPKLYQNCDDHTSSYILFWRSSHNRHWKVLLHSVSLRVNKIINICSESKSENFLLICHKWELTFEDFLIILVTIEPLLVLIEYVPYGDLLGYLRKSRGLNDTYFKDPDMKPQTNLTAEQLMKFAWQVADGMCYLSSKKVCFKCDLN